MRKLTGVILIFLGVLAPGACFYKAGYEIGKFDEKERRPQSYDTYGVILEKISLNGKIHTDTAFNYLVIRAKECDKCGDVYSVVLPDSSVYDYLTAIELDTVLRGGELYK